MDRQIHQVAAALEPVDGDRIAADGLSSQRVADGGALMYDLYVRFLGLREALLRVVTRCLDDFHAAVDNGLYQTRVVRRCY